MLPSIADRIATEIAADARQVHAAVELLDSGSTVPFIARYRKEATGGLDDTQLRTLEERLGYLRELEERRATVLKSIGDQDKLTPELQGQIEAADTKTRLEDLYLPYKPKRRTKAQIAREAGIGELAHLLVNEPARNPEREAVRFTDAAAGFADSKAVLDGARQILMEMWAEDPTLSGDVREWIWHNARLSSALVDGKAQSSLTTLISANPSKLSPLIARWPCFGPATKGSCPSSCKWTPMSLAAPDLNT